MGSFGRLNMSFLILNFYPVITCLMRPYYIVNIGAGKILKKIWQQKSVEEINDIMFDFGPLGPCAVRFPKGKESRKVKCATGTRKVL